MQVTKKKEGTYR